jgi:hypothetical protein
MREAQALIDLLISADQRCASPRAFSVAATSIIHIVGVNS